MSKYGIFIIESLRNGDYRDGHALEKILELSEIEVEYRPAKSKDDFIAFVTEFSHSGLRYLHVSCHAAKDGFEIGGEDISNAEIQDIFGDSLKKKRIFLSACEAGNRDLAARLIVNNKAYSVIGTPIELPFAKAAIFWPCLFHVVHASDNKKMNKKLLNATLKALVELICIPINYYSFVRGKPNVVTRKKIRKGIDTTTRKLLIG